MKAALKRYEHLRAKRANAIASLAHWVGRAVQMENSLLANVRNAVIKRVQMDNQIQRLLWILDYHAEAI